MCKVGLEPSPGERETRGYYWGEGRDWLLLDRVSVRGQGFPLDDLFKASHTSGGGKWAGTSELRACYSFKGRHMMKSQQPIVLRKYNKLRNICKNIRFRYKKMIKVSVENWGMLFRIDTRNQKDTWHKIQGKTNDGCPPSHIFVKCQTIPEIQEIQNKKKTKKIQKIKKKSKKIPKNKNPKNPEKSERTPEIPKNTKNTKKSLKSQIP